MLETLPLDAQRFGLKRPYLAVAFVRPGSLLVLSGFGESRHASKDSSPNPKSGRLLGQPVGHEILLEEFRQLQRVPPVDGLQPVDVFSAND